MVGMCGVVLMGGGTMCVSSRERSFMLRDWQGPCVYAAQRLYHVCEGNGWVPAYVFFGGWGGL